jgi:hypothetical protein
MSRRSFLHAAVVMSLLRFDPHAQVQPCTLENLHCLVKCRSWIIREFTAESYVVLWPPDLEKFRVA